VDLEIRVFRHDCREPDLVFVESKLGTTAQGDQLYRYADHAGASRHIARRFLAYVTRDFDPQEAMLDWLRTEVSGLSCVSSRWHVFYRLLEKARPDAFTEEVLLFMEQQGMAQTNRFTPLDVLTLANVQAVIGLMDSTLSGEIEAEFEKVAGSVKKGGTRRSQLVNKNRYIIYTGLANGMWCGLGYYLPDADLSGYPMLRTTVEIDYRAPKFRDIVQKMSEIAKIVGWNTYDLDSAFRWAGIYRAKSLEHLLHEADHVEAVKQEFRDQLSDLATVREQFGGMWVDGPPSEPDGAAEQGGVALNLSASRAARPPANQ
jgi:hypothetical protein